MIDLELREAIDELQQWLVTELRKHHLKTKDGKKISISVGKAEKSYLQLMEQVKAPLVLVNRKRQIILNVAAKKYAIEEELREALELLIENQFIVPPVGILLTRSLHELADMAPDLPVSKLKGEGYGFEAR